MPGSAGFSEYSAWRSAKGVSNSIYSMEDIVSAYPGVDNAEKLRNFIINAYQTWANSSQPLEYVILGGDDEIVRNEAPMVKLVIQLTAECLPIYILAT